MWQLGPDDNLNILSLSPSAIPGSAEWQALLLGKGWGLRGRLSPSKHLIPTFIVLARKKTKACLEREGASGTEGRSEPAAWQTLWIRFQRLRPTPSPFGGDLCAGVCDPASIKRPAGTGRVQRDSGQRGSLRQRRWFLSASLPAAPCAHSVCPLARSSSTGKGQEALGLEGGHCKSSNRGSESSGHQPEA